MSLSPATVESMTRQEVALWTSWHHSLQTAYGDRYGIEVRDMRDATLLMVQGIPVTHYNRLILTGPRGAEALEAATPYFRERMTPFRVDVGPATPLDRTAARVEGLGFGVVDVQASLSGPPRPRSRQRKGSPDVRVRRVHEREIDFFARLYEHAYFGPRQPAGLSELRIDSIKARFRDPAWHFYISFIDGMPAGGGALFVHEGIATVSGGATIYTLRGRGGQGALLRERLADAAVFGCHEVLGRTSLGGSSQRNMERVGLYARFRKLIYEQRWGATLPERSPAVHVHSNIAPSAGSSVRA